MADIFLSYSSEDRERVRPIRDALVQRGFSVFWDLDDSANVVWDSQILNYLNESKCVVIVWSSNSAASGAILHEVTTRGGKARQSQSS
jgi:adenylate cyclase